MHINSVTVSGKNKDSAVVTFSDGINLIVGPSNSGKSLIMNCIDFCLGAKDRNVLDKIDNISNYGYEQVTIDITTSERHFSITRKIGDNKSVSINHSDIKYLTSKLPTLSDYMLEQLGVHGSHSIRAFKSEEKRTVQVTWRQIMTHFYASQNHIESPDPIFYIPHSTNNKTAVPYLSLFLINGTNADDIEPAEDPVIINAKIKGEIEHVERELNEIDAEKKKTENGVIDNSNRDISMIMQEISVQIDDIQKEISDAIQESHRLLDKIYEINSNISKNNVILNQFDYLRSQYISDIKRMSFIVEGEQEIKKYPVKKTCPLCGQNITSNEEEKHDYSSAIVYELNSRKKKLEDLNIAEKDLNEKQTPLINEVESLQTKKSRLDKKINEILTPKLHELQKELASYDTITKETHKKEFTKEREKKLVKELERLRSLPKAVSHTHDYREDFPLDIVESLSTRIKTALEIMHYPLSDVAYFDLDNYDVKFGKYNKAGIAGGGFCSVANATVLMEYAQYLNECGTYAPGLAIIDSPLSSFSESEYKQEQDTVTRGFTEYLLGERLKTQVIIAEHSQNIYHLEELPKDKINIIEFTEDESHGRYGFIPGLTNEIISGR